MCPSCTCKLQPSVRHSLTIRRLNRRNARSHCLVCVPVLQVAQHMPCPRHPIQGHRRHTSPTAHTTAVASMVQPSGHECTWRQDTRTGAGHPIKEEQRHLAVEQFCFACRIRIVATRCTIPLLACFPQLRNQAYGRRNQVQATKAPNPYGEPVQLGEGKRKPSSCRMSRCPASSLST